MLRIISKEPEPVKGNLIKINQLINQFVDQYEGEKLHILHEPKFTEAWAKIVDIQSEQRDNVRRLYMVLYVHPLIGTIRIAKWLPARNVHTEDNVYLTQFSDLLKFDSGLFAVDAGSHKGYYHRCRGLCWNDREATILNTPSQYDSAYDTTMGSNDQTPIVVEDDNDKEFSESDDDAFIKAGQAARQGAKTSSTSSNAPPPAEPPMSTIDSTEDCKYEIILSKNY